MLLTHHRLLPGLLMTDCKLLFTKYILSTMTLATAIDFSSATERQITPFHALKDSFLVKNNLLGCFLPCHPCFYIRQGHPPAYGRHLALEPCYPFPRSHKYPSFSTMCRCFLSESCGYGQIMTGESCIGKSCFKPGSPHYTEIGCNLSLGA